MIDPHIREELLVALDNLPEEAQRRVAEYARTLTARQSPGGSQLTHCSDS